MRFEITPQEDEQDLSGWFKYFNHVGLDILSLLIARKIWKLNKLDEDISDVRMTFIKNFMNIKISLIILKRFLEKEDLEQKKKKYSRYLEDYKAAKVFK